MTGEALLAIFVLLAGLLGWEVIQQRKLSQRERDMWKEAEKAKGDAEKKRIEDEHESSVGKPGSDWFGGWLAKRRGKK